MRPLRPGGLGPAVRTRANSTVSQPDCKTLRDEPGFGPVRNRIAGAATPRSRISRLDSRRRGHCQSFDGRPTGNRRPFASLPWPGSASWMSRGPGLTVNRLPALGIADRLLANIAGLLLHWTIHRDGHQASSEHRCLSWTRPFGSRCQRVNTDPSQGSMDIESTPA